MGAPPIHGQHEGLLPPRYHGDGLAWHLCCCEQQGGVAQGQLWTWRSREAPLPGVGCKWGGCGETTLPRTFLDPPESVPHLADWV